MNGAGIGIEVKTTMERASGQGAATAKKSTTAGDTVSSNIMASVRTRSDLE